MKEDEMSTTPDNQPAHRPTPTAAAQAASRARRIGGRPMPGPRPGPSATAVLDEPTISEDAPTTPERAPRAARPRATPKRPSARRTRRWLPRLIATALAVVALVLAGGTAWFSHGVWWGTSSPNAASAQKVRQQVLAAATTCFGAVTSYDYRSLAKSEAAGLACTTGVFQTDYKKTMETTVTSLAPQSKTVQVYQANKAGIVSVSPDGTQWVVLLYGQQQVTNASTGTGSPQLEILSGRMTLDRVGGKWLVAALQQA
jgi:hypothetical protein